MAAPVFEENGTVEFYLPPGRWFSFWDGKEVQGGGWRKEIHGFLQLPLYIYEGTVLVLGQAQGDGGFGYNWLGSGGEVRLYGVKTGDRAVLVETNGDEKGILEVDSDGELKGFDSLQGDWKVSRLG